MKRLLLIAAFVILAVLGSGGAALAQGDERSDRACFGAFVSTGAVQAHPLGQTVVSYEAREVYHPFGEQISYLATTCDFPSR